MGFQQGLSGLNVSAKALDAIGNNVANANTVGYKMANAQFADVFASSLAGGGAGQVGIGSSVGAVSQLFTQGNVTATSNPLDMAINGSGFYRMATTGGAVTYTRSGQFELDKNGYVINSSGLRLTGYAADPTTGQISPGSLVPLQVINSNIAPKVSTASSIQLNLDQRAKPPSAMTSGSLTGGKNLAASPPTTITTGVNDHLDLVVDGNDVSVDIPPGSYTPSELATQLTALINAGLSGGVAVTVTGSAGSPLTITSNSKGTLGGQTPGSSVAIKSSTLGGNGASQLLGAPTTTTAPVTPAVLTGGVTIPATNVVIGSGQSFSLTVGATTATVSVPAGNYATSGALAAALQTAVNTAFAPAGTVTVVAAAAGPLTLTGPAASTIITAKDATTDLQGLFGPTMIAGADNFNAITAATSGKVTGGTALNTAAAVGPPVVVSTIPIITAATNDTLNVTVDGQSVSVTLTPKAAPGYDGSGAGSMLADLAADVQAKINTALGLVSATKRVTASISGNKLVIASNTTGTSSTVSVTGGTAATTLLGASPVTLDGTQTQTINALGFTASTAQTVYDSQGGAHNLALYFVKTSQANAWQMYSTLDNAQQRGPVTLTFNGSGVLTTPMPMNMPADGDKYTFTPSATNAAKPDDLGFTLDLTGTTQYGLTFGVNTLNQDGYASGQLSGIAVGADGTIQGRFSNGQSKAMGQIVLVSFNNPNGLQSLGGNQWADTSESGQPIPGTPGTGSLGVIQSAAVEESNVDLTAELVQMITQQRVYQANAQTIKTQDQVLSTLVNLR